MPRRDQGLTGPETATAADIPAINALFSEAFTERYHRDGLSGVRVPLLNPGVWRYAIEDAGEGALVWRDAEGELAAFTIAHHSGVEGWMGPLAVRSGLQGHGLGATIVRAGIDRLRARGVRVIGLETMPRTVDNIGFYSRIGFEPGHLTIALTRAARRGDDPVRAVRLERQGPGRARQLGACRTLTDRLAPGVDFTREIELTDSLELGGTTLLPEGPEVRGFAVWHSVPLASGRAAEEVRVLKLVAANLATLEDLLAGLAAEAASLGLDRVTVRAQSAFGDAYRLMVQAGFRVQWTDLRMTLTGYPEVAVAEGAVVFSNWEI